VNGEPGQLGHRPYLSYAPPDRPLARQLHAALRARGLDPWFDADQIRPGDALDNALEQGMAESTSMIVLCTSTPPSELQHRAWERARRLDRPIVPVLLDAAVLPEPLAGLHPIVARAVSEELADTLYEQSGDAIALGPPPPGLLEATANGELVVFVGAGLAAGAGYPMWSELVGRLLDWAERKQRLDPELLRSLRSSLRSGERNSVADTVAESIGPSELARSIGEVFGFEKRSVLATGSVDGSVRLWDATTGVALGELAGHTGRVSALVGLELEGRSVLASGDDDGMVRLWDVAGGVALGELAGQMGPVTAVAVFHLDGGPVLASGGYDGTVRLWDLTTGTQVGDPLTRHDGKVTALAAIEYHDAHTLQPPPPIYQALDALPVAAALTTNYDRLLDRIWTGLPRVTWRDSGRVLDHLSLRQPFVLHVYGRPDDAESLVFSPAQFDELLDANLEVARALEAVFSSRTLLFVGCSLRGISDFVEALSVRSRVGPAHYAVAHADSPTWRAEADKLRRRYNIEVLAYSGAAHEQVTTFLSNLSGRPARPAGPAGARAEKLARVQLENIGPYGHLELELDPSWNVLLGDNGVGKSSILKAIALVYSGDESPTYADRLLRVGASHGSIRVETTSGRSFHTELLRSTTGVQVRHVSGVRLEAEGHLVLGLPPLRSLSWRRETGPSGGETSRRPSPSDLLPLLAGDLDPRLDAVKQRIINCDYLIKDAITRETDASPHRRLLEDLVRAMLEFTDKLAVRFQEVDAQTNAVFVNTVDGRLPIEALSQGTGALIAWVSFIIQRLHDTAAEGEVPLQREAIVLIDELDAHLHPGWQQQLTHRLGTLFPNLQFVGTTHSPLIVGGMKQRQVTVLARQDGPVAKVQLPGNPDDEIRGRADQLLTGRLFGLTTSVDIGTRHMVERYNALLGKDRTPKEDAEFYGLQSTLEVRIPVSATTPAERRARDLLDLLLRESIGSKLPEARELLLDKAGLLLEEAGRMRPITD
jgi:hypothetical protein